MATAQRLEGKFSEALGKLDQRSQSLLKFFNECEARVVALERGKSDYEQSQRMAALSDRADLVIGDATATLAGIGESFVNQAIRVGEALGSFERIQLKSLAGEIELDHIEAVADRIIESSVAERAALRDLTASVSDGLV